MTTEVGGIKRKDRSFDSETSSQLETLFHQYQKELDCSHDKRERIVKVSRDVTVHSKRIIFLLHRALPLADKASILMEAECKLQEVTKLLHCIANEVTGEDATRYKGAYSPGVQEFIEALSFYHYWKEGTLLSYSLAQVYMTFHDTTDPLMLFLTPFDYLLGLADLTGELMRVAINSVGSGLWNTPPLIARFIRELYCGLISFNHFSMSREFPTKLNMVLNNLLKVEHTCYAMKVRSYEVPILME